MTPNQKSEIGNAGHDRVINAAAAGAEGSSGRERSKRNLVPGRKSLTGVQGQTSPPVNVRVPDDVREGLRDVAGGNSITKVARQALDEAQLYYVVWEQSFDGTTPQWVRFDKAMTLEKARQAFDQFKTSARTLQFRRMQIRRGKTMVIDEWTPYP